MKDFEIGINIPWFVIKYQDVLELYKENFSTCKRLGITHVRIFFTRWSMSPIYRDEDIPLLAKVLDVAEIHGIKIIPVLFHFTDFIDYRNGAKKEEFSRLNNPFKKGKINTFFKDLDEDMVRSVDRVLDVLDERVETIELFNEIDLVPARVDNKVARVNSLKSHISKKYNFNLWISLADDFQYKKYEKVTCKLDSHFYSYPYDRGLKNIEYYRKWRKDSYLGEYARYSDQSYINRQDTLAFFLSWLYGALFYWYKVSPYSWWWDEILANKKYLKSIEVFWSVVPLIKKDRIESLDLKKTDIMIQFDNIDTKENSGGGESPLLQKVKERVWDIIAHPKNLFNEIRALKKLWYKIIHSVQKESIFLREYEIGNKTIIYVESSNKSKKITINTEKSYVLSCINLQTGEVISKKEFTLKPFENYLVILEYQT